MGLCSWDGMLLPKIPLKYCYSYPFQYMRSESPINLDLLGLSSHNLLQGIQNTYIYLSVGVQGQIRGKKGQILDTNWGKSAKTVEKSIYKFTTPLKLLLMSITL